MNNFTRIALLFFALISFCHPLLAETATDASLNNTNPASAAFLREIFKKSNSQLSLTTNSIAVHSVDQDDECQELSMERDEARKKRKYKRALTSSATFRQPVKEIIVSLPIDGTESYTTPHFVSHLHRFLFRLTPF